MANDEFDSSPSESESSEFQTQFIPKENDEEELWDVIEILEEKGRKYKGVEEEAESEEEGGGGEEEVYVKLAPRTPSRLWR
ncbi:hypothetical protein NUW54_g11465 [Trametes sanguinea]|uniref:Uncharacterized protein n=1 Tax=Trametes sanguinea TaxID=158606 RepID=A0ACC1NEN1_9APHY|nr:hypothetical protein NUW54_g11465 [Trametes sanguinea]